MFIHSLVFRSLGDYAILYIKESTINVRNYASFVCPHEMLRKVAARLDDDGVRRGFFVEAKNLAESFCRIPLLIKNILRSPPKTWQKQR